MLVSSQIKVCYKFKTVILQISMKLYIMNPLCVHVDDIISYMTFIKRLKDDVYAKLIMFGWYTT